MRSSSLKHCLAGTIAAAVFAPLLILSVAPPRSMTAAPLPRIEPKPAAGWPMLGGSPARNMASTTAHNLPIQWMNDDGEPLPGKFLWKADLGSRTHGGPVVAGGKVFVGTNNQNPRDTSLRTIRISPTDTIVKVGDVPVKDDAHLQAILAKLPLGNLVDCTVLRNGNLIQENVPIVNPDLGVLMAFSQGKGKFLYQTVFRKLPNGANDWPLQGLCSAPTVEGDRLYFTSNRCEVVCADINNGKIVWKLDMIKELGVYPHNMTACSPLIFGDALYVITSNGVDEGHLNIPAPWAPSFLKLDKRTGEVLWQDNSPTIQFEGPAGFTNQVNRAEIVQHGQWSHPAFAVVDGQAQIVFPGGDGWIRSFTPEGKLLWRFDCNPKEAEFHKGTRSDFIGAPVIYKDRVYIGMGQDPEHNPGVGHLWCIAMNRKGDVSPELVVNPAVWPPVTKPNPNSAMVWHHGGWIAGAQGRRNYQFGRTMSTCAIHDDLVYAADLGGMLQCLDAATGRLYWEHDTRSQIWCSPYWADGKVYLGTDNGEVWVFAHGKQKTLLAKNDMELPIRNTPVAVGDVLYVISGNQLLAIKK